MNNPFILPFKWFAVVGFLFISTVPAHADMKSFCKGVGSAACAALDKKDYGEALRAIKPFVENNNADALYVFGALHIEGMGVPKNLEIARNFVKRAANKGQLRAKKILSKIHDMMTEDAEKSKDPDKLIKIHKLLVEDGNSYGAVQLGFLYSGAFGSGELLGNFPENKKEALAWFQRAKELGDTSKIIAEQIATLKTGISQDATKILLQDFVYGNDIRKLEDLRNSVKNLCKGNIKCSFDKVWAYMDISKDGRLSLAEISRLQRNIVKFAAVGQDKNATKTEEVAAINLASIIFLPITASSVLHSFDYNNDGFLSKKEVLGDTEFSKLVGVDVDKLATGLNFQSLGEKLKKSMNLIPFLK